MPHTNLPNLKSKPFGGAYSIHDTATCITREEARLNFKCDNADKLKKDFLNLYKQWMFEEQKIIGWQAYNELCYTNGTSDSFGQFFLRYKGKKRLRLAKSEYFYSQMCKSLYFDKNFAWLDEDEIRSGDVVLVSAPFSNTGAIPDYLEKLLTDCDEKSVPVMLDLAYVNLGCNFNIDLSHECIEYVVSSLSKVFPVENYRIGIRLQKQKFEDPIYVINENDYNYINLLGAYVGKTLMEKYSSDYIYQKYKQSQNEMCTKLDLEPSPCVIFGLDHRNKYTEYSRGSAINRLCFSRVWDGRMKYA